MKRLTGLPDITEDQSTKDYFDTFTPSFDPRRFEFALSFLRENGTSESKLIDIGCGDGATLSLIQQQTPLTDLTGMDISENYLRKAEVAVGCKTISGSILDSHLVMEYVDTYDFCVLGAVLHHLIGPTRAESHHAANRCMRNAMTLLKPGGHLVVFEPTFGPAFLLPVIFYVKKLFGRFFSGRLEFGRRWANFGQPVVSFYTTKQLDEMARKRGEIVERTIVDSIRYGVIVKRVAVGIVIRKLDRNTCQCATHARLIL